MDALVSRWIELLRIASDPRAGRRARHVRYLSTVLLVFTALVLTLRVPNVEQSPFFSLFLAAIAISAYLFGWKAGSLATVLSAAVSIFFMLRPIGSLSIADSNDFLRFVLFTVTSVVICSLSAALSASRTAGLRLANEKRQLEIAQSAGGVWIWEYDPEFDVVTWKDNYAPVQQVCTASFEEWVSRVHTQDREPVRQALAGAHRTGSYDLKYRFSKSRSGNEYGWVIARGALTHVSGRAILIGITLDSVPKEQPRNSLVADRN